MFFYILDLTTVWQSFAIAGPKAWNSLPSELRCIAVDSTFRHCLKAELFSRACGVLYAYNVYFFFHSHIVKRLRPLFGEGTTQIHID